MIVFFPESSSLFVKILIFSQTGFKNQQFYKKKKFLNSLHFRKSLHILNMWIKNLYIRFQVFPHTCDSRKTGQSIWTVLTSPHVWLPNGSSPLCWLHCRFTKFFFSMNKNQKTSQKSMLLSDWRPRLGKMLFWGSWADFDVEIYQSKYSAWVYIVRARSQPSRMFGNLDCHWFDRKRGRRIILSPGCFPGRMSPSGDLAVRVGVRNHWCILAVELLHQKPQSMPLSFYVSFPSFDI